MPHLTTVATTLAATLAAPAALPALADTARGSGGSPDPGTLALLGFLGAWLLVRDPLWQASTDLSDQDYDCALPPGPAPTS